MAKQRDFAQIDLIGATGNQYNSGICLGLVVQWLISINKTISQESQFWSDLDGSLAKTENVPLLGKGYARKAIEFQGEYRMQLNGDPTIGQYARTQLSAEGLQLGNATTGGNAFAAVNAIATRVLTNDYRYFILVVRGTAGAHAIGLHRDYSLTGKSSSVQVFDPNFGKYTCAGSVSLEGDLAAIGALYNGGLHASYSLEAYKS